SAARRPACRRRGPPSSPRAFRRSDLRAARARAPPAHAPGRPPPTGMPAPPRRPARPERAVRPRTRSSEQLRRAPGGGPAILRRNGGPSEGLNRPPRPRPCTSGLPMKAVIVSGVRTPFSKAGTDLKHLSAIELGKIAVRELLARSGVPGDAVDQLVYGT